MTLVELLDEMFKERTGPVPFSPQLWNTITDCYSDESVNMRAGAAAAIQVLILHGLPADLTRSTLLESFEEE